MLEFYDFRQEGETEIDLSGLLERTLAFTASLYDGYSKSPRWLAVGSIGPERSPFRIPPRYMFNPINKSCTIVLDDDFGNTRPGTREECVELEPIAAWETEHIEERLRDYYAGRQNVHFEAIRRRLFDR